MKASFVRTYLVATALAWGACPPLPAAAASEGAKAYLEWSDGVRRQCDRAGGDAQRYRCMADAHISDGRVPPDKIEFCRSRAAQLRESRPGDRDQSLWMCLSREGKRHAERGAASSGAPSPRERVAAQRADSAAGTAIDPRQDRMARQPACEAWAADNIGDPGLRKSYMARCLHGQGTPESLGAGYSKGPMPLSAAAPTGDAGAVRAKNRDWCAKQNAGRGGSGYLRYDCDCVDRETARHQVEGRLAERMIAQQQFDLNPCVNRAATADQVVAGMLDPGMRRMYGSEARANAIEACYRRAVERDMDVSELADYGRLRGQLSQRCNKAGL